MYNLFARIDCSILTVYDTVLCMFKGGHLGRGRMPGDIQADDREEKGDVESVIIVGRVETTIHSFYLRGPLGKRCMDMFDDRLTPLVLRTSCYSHSVSCDDVSVYNCFRRQMQHDDTLLSRQGLRKSFRASSETYERI